MVVWERERERGGDRQTDRQTDCGLLWLTPRGDRHIQSFASLTGGVIQNRFTGGGRMALSGWPIYSLATLRISPNLPDLVTLWLLYDRLSGCTFSFQFPIHIMYFRCPLFTQVQYPVLKPLTDWSVKGQYIRHLILFFKMFTCEVFICVLLYLSQPISAKEYIRATTVKKHNHNTTFHHLILALSSHYLNYLQSTSSLSPNVYIKIIIQIHISF